MRTVGAYEAKTHLSQILDEVTRGERVAITKNGTPVALLVPVPATQKPDAREVIRQLREFRREITLGGISVRKMIEEGRRG
jgi:prevent-host-death family protein